MQHTFCKRRCLRQIKGTCNKHDHLSLASPAITIRYSTTATAGLSLALKLPLWRKQKGHDHKLNKICLCQTLSNIDDKSTRGCPPTLRYIRKRQHCQDYSLCKTSLLPTTACSPNICPATATGSVPHPLYRFLDTPTVLPRLPVVLVCCPRTLRPQ